MQQKAIAQSNPLLTPWENHGTIWDGKLNRSPCCRAATIESVKTEVALLIMKLIETKNAPGAIGPYVQGYVVNNIVYTSGQIPVNPADGTVPEGIAAQAEQSCKNVGAILEAAGSDLTKVIKTTCFLAEIADFAAFNEVYARYFTGKPARSCVAVKDLPKGVPCEIEAIAEA